MVLIKAMDINEAERLSEIDRSEYIRKIYRIQAGGIQEVEAGHECGNWDESMLEHIKGRFQFELAQGGKAFGAYDGERLVGFGVLAHRFRGRNRDRLQVDLMYVTRSYRRQGIGSRLMAELKKEAVQRGARYLYISSTETESAVSFYRYSGSELAEEIDKELLALEPEDIHMLIKL
ncbi:GNAT family N-acetyltransferase [Paenibacillus caui]|uniref:GNAT family N-acetyltransferase n=1 Tax=Paenibacillus caui TaxID=2873927 RepID=UPI001CA8421B|nr:GNAT family N-acetyltransferase [Paenibacillus caui]